jgi:hypothetical protein
MGETAREARETKGTKQRKGRTQQTVNVRVLPYRAQMSQDLVAERRGPEREGGLGERGGKGRSQWRKADDAPG